MNVYELKPVRRRLRLGRGGFVYVAATGLILCAAIYTQANLLFWSFGLVMGGLGVSVVLAVISLRKMGLQRVLPSHGVVDEPLVLRYHIVNRSRLAVFGLVIYETWGKGRRGWKKQGPASKGSGQLGGRPFGWLLHLGPQQTLQAEATCWPRRRGALGFERVVVDCGFPFGIVHKTVEFVAPGEVLIYPHLHRINRRLFFTLSHTDASGRKQIDRGGGTEDFYGLRPYRYGDSIKLVDWRRTASSGRMMIRELTHPSPPRMMIVLDLRQRSEAAVADQSHDLQAERAISLAASLICDAYLNGYQIGLEVVGGGERFVIHHSLPHRTRMIDSLARLNWMELRDDKLISERPSVIVRRGRGGSMDLSRSKGMSAQPLILGGDDLDQYVQPASIDSPDLLHRVARTSSKREQLAEVKLAQDSRPRSN